MKTYFEKLARKCMRAKELTQIPRNQSLLLHHTMIEYESEFSRWTSRSPPCSYRERARSAIHRIVLQKKYTD